MSLQNLLTNINGEEPTEDVVNPEDCSPVYKDIGLHDVYELLKEFVKNYPNHSNRCRRLQTFAVLESVTQLNTENLGKTILDKNKPFFFSREWASKQHNPSKLSFNFPALIAFDRGTTFVDPFSKKIKTCYSLDIGVFDKFDQDCADKKSGCKDPCASRVPSEIFKHTQDFLMTLFAFLCDLICVKKDGKNKWYHKGYYQANKEDIGGKICNKTTGRFQQMLKRKNPNLSGDRFEGGINCLYGTYVNIKLCFDCCGQYSYSPEEQTYKDGGDTGCC